MKTSKNVEKRLLQVVLVLVFSLIAISCTQYRIIPIPGGIGGGNSAEFTESEATEALQETLVNVQFGSIASQALNAKDGETIPGIKEIKKSYTAGAVAAIATSRADGVELGTLSVAMTLEGYQLATGATVSGNVTIDLFGTGTWTSNQTNDFVVSVYTVNSSLRFSNGYTTIVSGLTETLDEEMPAMAIDNTGAAPVVTGANVMIDITAAEGAVTVVNADGESAEVTLTGSELEAPSIIDGSVIQTLIDAAGEGDSITLADNTTYVFSSFLDINKENLTLAGGTNTVLDFSKGMNGKPFGLTEGNPNGYAIGLVNIYADGVTLRDVKIIGDLEVSKKNLSSDNKYEAYERAFGIFISKTTPEITASNSVVKSTITLENVEITGTTKAAVYAYCIYADDSLGEKNALEIKNLYVHDIGDLATTHINASGLYFQSAKNILVDGADIDVGSNGPAVVIHMSTKQGPLVFQNTKKLAGTYDDSLDLNWIYKEGISTGAFSGMQNPLMLNFNISSENTTKINSGLTAEDSISLKQLNGEGKEPYLLKIDWYGIDTIGSDYSITAENAKFRSTVYAPLICLENMKN